MSLLILKIRLKFVRENFLVDIRAADSRSRAFIYSKMLFSQSCFLTMALFRSRLRQLDTDVSELHISRFKYEWKLKMNDSHQVGIK